MNMDQFGLCVKCRTVASPPVGHHSVMLYKDLLNEVNASRSYAYDLCDNCIEELIDWIEEVRIQ